MEKVNKILLLGSSGQIGSNLKKKLKLITKKVKILSKRELNLENLNSIKKVLDKIQPNLIINAAGYTKVDEAEKKKDKCFKINTLSTNEIAKWCYKNDCFLVHYSTVYIFDGKKKKPWKEGDKTKPKNFYGKTKLKGEVKIIKSKCNYLILRLNWIYNNHGENFPKKIIKKIKENKKIFLVNNQIGTPNHAGFISDISINIIKKVIIDKKNPKILNVSARGKANYYDFAKKIYEKLKNKYKDCSLTSINSEDYKKISSNKKTAERPLNSLLDITKLENFLKLKMPYWDDVLEKRINAIIKKYTK